MECPKCHFDNPDDTLKCSKCATLLPSSKEISVTETLETPAEELTKGTTLASRYEIMEELGRGGMGRVYKVHDTEIKEKVALKLLKPEIAADKKSIERFRNELKIARKVSHKRVCRMYDIGKEEEKYFITMEYVEGEDLKSLIREKGKMAEDEVLRLAKQICEGLVEAHELGIVHRDLKPQNIMIDKERNAKIMDFGIARSVEAPGVTQTGVIIGTPDYISPEQAEGKEADQRSDIYALGIILYEMATGSVPFKGDTALSVAIKHKSQLPKEPRKLNPEVSKDLNRLILICMEKDRERRYQKAEDLLPDIRNIEEGFPLGSKIQPRRMTFMATLIRKKLFIPTAALLVIAAVTILQFIPRETSFQIDPNKPSLAIMYFKNNTGDEGLDHWRSAFCQWLMTDLSQSQYIDVLPEDRLFSILRKMKLLEEKSYATEDLKKIAEEGQVNHIFQASLSKAGDMFRVDYTLQEANNLEIIGSDSVRGAGEESFPKIVDELTRKIKTNLEFSENEIANDIDGDIGTITTSSPLAFKYYVEGRNLSLRGEWELSISFYKKAIEFDPEFAVANLAIAGMYSNLGKRDEAEKYYKKAFELSNRISDRERYLIQGQYYLRIEEDVDKAIDTFTKLLELYPDDIRGNSYMGGIYNIIGEREKQKKYNELAYLKNKNSVPLVVNLARTYERFGLIDKAIEVWEDYSTNVPDNINAHIYLNRLYIGKGRYDLAHEEAEQIYALNPKRRYWYYIYYLQGNFPTAEKEAKLELEIDEEWFHYQARERLAHLYCTQGQFEKAEEQLRKGIEKGEESEPTRMNILWTSRFHNDLAYIYLLKGNLEEALKNPDIAWKRAEEYKFWAYQWTSLTIKAYAYLKMKLFDEALKVADELKESIEKSSPYEKIIQERMYPYYQVMGKIEHEKGNFLKAITYFNEALSLAHNEPLYKPADYIEALAFAYYKSGKLEEARKEYEKIPRLTHGRRDDADNRAIYAKNFLMAKSFYMLGIIYEQSGKKRKAIEHYEKFLNLWKDADPGIPELEDAKKRLAGLKSQ